MYQHESAVAILHQAAPPVEHGGIVKAAKPGGYRDSGADIAFSLRQAGVRVVTPRPVPDPAGDSDWTFPDTETGLKAAVEAGATILWANTVLFCGHPLEQYRGMVRFVGQLPATVDRYDDKAVMNQELRDIGVTVVRHVLVAATPSQRCVVSLDDLSSASLAHHGLSVPLVIKPIRGRGSAGVTVVDTPDILRSTVIETIESRQFGSALMIEPFLPGDEITITVMPPDCSGSTDSPRHWCLPPIRRCNHHRGVAPYNGTVAVVHNSGVMPATERTDPAVRNILRECRRVAEHIDARAPIRIDCRQDPGGAFQIFDVNLKPNMTGPGRPGRNDQLSLTGMAAEAAGMSYSELLITMLSHAWE